MNARIDHDRAIHKQEYQRGKLGRLYERDPDSRGWRT